MAASFPKWSPGGLGNTCYLLMIVMCWKGNCSSLLPSAKSWLPRFSG